MPRYRLQPDWLVRQLQGLDAPTDLERYQATQFLLVRLKSDVCNISLALDESLADTTTTLPPAVKIMRYQTANVRRLRRSAIDELNPELNWLLELRAHPFYIVPISKKPTEDPAFASKVCVGRALNQDIVLRDDSVSKFHAWFERNDTGGLFLFEAGSKNGTRVGGIPVKGRAARWVQPAERIEFGAIVCYVCDPPALTAVLRSPSNNPP